MKKKDKVTVTTAPAWNLPPQPDPDRSSTETTGGACEPTMYGSVEQFKTSKAASAAKPKSRRPSVEHAQVDDDLYGS